MISLRKLLVESTIACGECLSYAWKTYMVNQNNKRMRVAFGTVQNEWISNNKRYPHAWIEDGNLVKDWQTMVAGSSKYAGKGWPKKEFYSFWKPKNVKKYTTKEAADTYLEKKSMIGWDW